MTTTQWDRLGVTTKEQLREAVPHITFSARNGLQWVWARPFDEPHEQIWWEIKEPIFLEILNFSQA